MSGGTHDAMLAIGLVVAFAALMTAHVATVFGLARRRGPGVALAAFFVPPLAPYFAFTRGMRARGIAWITSATLYAVALSLALGG